MSRMSGCARAEADREQEQRHRNAERAVDTAGQRHLHDEASEGQVDRDLCEQRRDRIAVEPVASAAILSC